MPLSWQFESNWSRNFTLDSLRERKLLFSHVKCVSHFFYRIVLANRIQTLYQPSIPQRCNCSNFRMSSYRARYRRKENKIEMELVRAYKQVSSKWMWFSCQFGGHSNGRKSIFFSLVNSNRHLVARHSNCLNEMEKVDFSLARQHHKCSTFMLVLSMQNGWNRYTIAY